MRIKIIFLALLVLVPSVSYAADGVLFLSPGRGTYTTGDVFEVDVRADTDGQAANAVEADISFNASALSVESVSTEGSILSLWPTPVSFSNESGTVRFSGTAGQGFSAHDALLVRIQFRAKNNLPGDVHFDSGAILANDARATNIIASMRSGLYTIVAHQVQPSEDVAQVAASDTPPETPEVKGASIQVPTITGYDDRVSIGERIVLQGSAAPNSKLSIFLQYEENAPIESAVLATSDGNFTYVAREPAQEGTYHAWAAVSGAEDSSASDKVVIVGHSAGVAAAAESITSMLTVALPYLLLLIVAGFAAGLWYHHRARSGNSA